MQPAGFVGGVLSHAFISWGIVQQDSAARKILEEVLLIPVPFLLTLIQYYLIGLVIDKLVTRKR